MKAVLTKEKYPKVLLTTNFPDYYIEDVFGGDLYNMLSDSDKVEYTREQLIMFEGEVPDFPIMIEDEIRQATREEQFEFLGEESFILDDGEYIENQELKIVNKPSQHHEWDRDSNKWIVNLEDVKEIYRNHFKKELYSKVYSNLSVEDEYYQMGKNDIENFKELLDGIEIRILNKKIEYLKMGKNINEAETEVLKTLSKTNVGWRLLDNSEVEKTVVDMISIYVKWLERKIHLNLVYNLINRKIVEAVEYSEVVSINWDECEKLVSGSSIEL